ECPHLVPIDKNYAQQLVTPEDRDRDYGSEGVHLARSVGVLGVGLSIEYLNRTPLKSGTRGCAASSGCNWILLNKRSDFRGGVVGGHNAQVLTVKAHDE